MYRSKCVSEQSFRLQDEEQTAPHKARVADRRPIRKCLNLQFMPVCRVLSLWLIPSISESSLSTQLGRDALIGLAGGRELPSAHLSGFDWRVDAWRYWFP